MKFEIIIISILMMSMFGLGWFVNEVYESYQSENEYEKQFEGLRFVYKNNHPLAIEKAQTYDEYGDWVCVNVKGMKYERAIEVCNHEIGHEIFAEVCEKNMSRCLEVIK